MTFSTRNFDPHAPISPQISQVLHYKISFLLEAHCCRHHRRYKLIFIPLGYWELLAKNNFRTKIGRGLG